MYSKTKAELQQTLQDIESRGLTKVERVIDSPQDVHVKVNDATLLNFCANNYLGLADHPDVIAAAHKALDDYGFGMASVRFICGTHSLHTELENKISEFVSKEDTILFPSCFDANAGIFEVLLSEEDAVISDELNHASIIDGIRLCKAERYRYKNRDMNDLESKLIESQSARHRLIVTDGVFSMDGFLAPLDEISALAEKYDALLMVDDSHAVGFIGETGAGTAEFFGVQDKVDIISGTLGKALGGASGGYIASHQEIIDVLRQRARPYLFSNAIAPPAVAGALQALDLVKRHPLLREQLTSNASHFRRLMTDAGFALLPGSHPIIPVMFETEFEAVEMARTLGSLGIYVVAFSYPVVPLGKARIRVQISAAHSKEDIEKCVNAFKEARHRISTSGS
ncbi:MAG: glycine C-acetyltransferase [Candidatus Nanopelagicales bacterium]